MITATKLMYVMGFDESSILKDVNETQKSTEHNNILTQYMYNVSLRNIEYAIFLFCPSSLSVACTFNNTVLIAVSSGQEAE